jgi:hypothetical protein
MLSSNLLSVVTGNRPSTRLTLVTAWDTTTRPPSVRQSRFLRGGHDKGSRYQNAPPATADGAKNFSV